MKKESLSKNLIFQFMYQGLILVIPLILSPYLTRTLQETALGIYTYTNSIAYYFVMLSMLGISRHGQRIISQNSHDEIKLRKTFWSLFTVHIIVSLFFTIAYLIFITLLEKEYRSIYIIQTFYVLSAMFDITWLFYGLENFRSVVIKNGFIKIAECAAIFLLVKNPNDLCVYTIITAGGMLLGQVILLPQAIKLVPPIAFSKEEAAQHVKPLLVFAISVIAVSLYTVFDKTLLGIMTNKENVAFYEYSNKIITIPKTIIGVIGTVMFPRACKLAAAGDVVGQKKYINYSIVLTSIIGMGSIAGLIAVGDLFAKVYFGIAFVKCGGIIKSLSPLILIIGIGDIIRTQYMIPNHLDKQFNVCILMNALVNIVLSIVFIPIMGVYGAVIGTVSAEVFGIMFQLVICRRFIKLSEIIKPSLPYALIGGLMCIILLLIQSSFQQNLQSLLLLIITGAVIYCLLTALYLKFFNRELFIIMTKRFIKSKL